MVKTFKTQVYINDEFTQAYVERAFGVRRKIWNFGVASYKDCLKNGKRFSWQDVSKDVRNKLHSVPDDFFAWLSEQSVSGYIREECLKDLKESIEHCKALTRERAE